MRSRNSCSSSASRSGPPAARSSRISSIWPSSSSISSRCLKVAVEAKLGEAVAGKRSRRWLEAEEAVEVVGVELWLGGEGSGGAGGGGGEVKIDLEAEGLVEGVEGGEEGWAAKPAAED